MPEESIAVGSGTRRVEDIALDLMKFIAITTGYDRPAVRQDSRPSRRRAKT